MFEYTAEMVESILLSGPSHHLDDVEYYCDVEKALRWYCLEFPTPSQLVLAHIKGYTTQEMATRLKCPEEKVVQVLRRAYRDMAQWLNS